MPNSPSTVTVELTDAQIAGLFATVLVTMPLMARARLMNTLLHRHPRVFANLLLGPPREECGVDLSGGRNGQNGRKDD